MIQPGASPLRIAFLARHVGYLRNFDSVIALLAERGHDLHVILHIDEATAQDEKIIVEELRQEHPSIRFDQAPPLRRDDWWALKKAVRSSIDYLRYLDPRYDKARVLRTRSRKRTPNFVIALSDQLARRRRLAAWLFSQVRALERRIPINRAIESFLADLRPDIVLFTPLIDLGSQQLDYLMAARALGLRTVLCVMSWDHLSSKSMIRVLPDMVTVWNATQKAEAIELHGVPEDKIMITGAQCFDSWFERVPSTSRQEFCGKIGLDPARPFILYVCSSLMIGSAPESGFVQRWIERVRTHPHPTLREAGILVRPHPKRADEWNHVDLSGFSNLVVWPRAKSFPVGRQARRDFFDSMSHSAAVVGINTSALIEGGIVGRPVHTILLPEFRDNQEGTIHFHYLLGDNDGLLHVATSFEDHLMQLTASLLDGGEVARQRNERFVETFVRPYGLGVAATPVFCDAVERVATAPPPLPERPPALQGLLHGLLAAGAVGLRAGRRAAKIVKVTKGKIEVHGLRRGLVAGSRQSRRAVGRLGRGLARRAATWFEATIERIVAR